MKLPNILYLLGLVSVAVSASQYLASEHASKERNGLFVGHWAPTFLLLGQIAEDREKRGVHVLTGK